MCISDRVYAFNNQGGTLLNSHYVQKTDHGHACLADRKKSNTGSGLSSGRSMQQLFRGQNLVLVSDIGVTTLKAKIFRKETRDS